MSTEPNDKGKPIVSILKEYNRNEELINKTKKAFDKFVDISHAQGQKEEKIRQNYLNNFLVQINNSLQKLSNKESLIHLVKLKGEKNDQITKAEISKDKRSAEIFKKGLAIIDKKIADIKERVDLGIDRVEENSNAPVTDEAQNKGSAKGKSQLEEKEESEKQIFTLPDGFKQIVCGASEAEIIKYFNILAIEKNPKNGKPYLSASEVERLIHNNFAVFKQEPTGELFEANLKDKQKRTLIHFIYQFFDKYGATFGYLKKDYVNLLIWNFSHFNNDIPTSLSSNMTKSKAPTGAGLILIDKYLKS